MNLKSIFSRTKPKFHINPEHHISLAFTEAGGMKCSRFTDEFNIPSERGFAAFHHYECLAQRCDYDYLKTHTEAVLKILSETNVVKVGEAVKMEQQLQERLTMFFPPELIWKLASVLFFDETENPYTYDTVYAETVKIPRWKKNKEIYNFFLLVPFKDLMPRSGVSQDDFRNILKVANLIDQKHWENLLSALSSNPKKAAFIRKTLSRLKQDEAIYT